MGLQVLPEPGELLLLEQPRAHYHLGVRKRLAVHGKIRLAHLDVPVASPRPALRAPASAFVVREVREELDVEPFALHPLQAALLPREQEVRRAGLCGADVEPRLRDARVGVLLASNRGVGVACRLVAAGAAAHAAVELAQVLDYRRRYAEEALPLGHVVLQAHGVDVGHLRLRVERIDAVKHQVVHVAAHERRVELHERAREVARQVCDADGLRGLEVVRAVLRDEHAAAVPERLEKPSRAGHERAEARSAHLGHAVLDADRGGLLRHARIERELNLEHAGRVRRRHALLDALRHKTTYKTARLRQRRYIRHNPRELPGTRRGKHRTQCKCRCNHSLSHSVVLFFELLLFLPYNLYGDIVEDNL